MERKPLTWDRALMWRLRRRDDGSSAIQWAIPYIKSIYFYKALGYHLLGRDDEIQFADVEQTRQADEDRFKP